MPPRVPLELRAGQLPEASARLRPELRAFLDRDRADFGWVPRVAAWLGGDDPAFSQRLGARGWLGLVIPARYGGHEASALDRFVVIEELLAAGAPVACHWISDR